MAQPSKKPLVCFLCGDEIPSGWPVTFHHDDSGNLAIVHRFRNMCTDADARTQERWHVKEALDIKDSVTDGACAESKSKGDDRRAVEGEEKSE